MRFVEPFWIYSLMLALPLFVLIFLVDSWLKKRTTDKIGESRLALHILRPGQKWRLWISRLAMISGTLMCLLALSRPQYGAKVEEARQRGLDIVFAIDTSRSMLTPDIPPDRMRRAKFELSRFFRERARGDRVAIVPFAGRSHVLCPLTMDYGAARMFLDSVDVGVIPQQGTDIAEVLRRVDSAFDQKRSRTKILVLLTDGEDHSGKVEEEAKRLAERGIIVYAVGIGSLTGEPVPEFAREDGEVEWHRDRDGKVVVSRLDQKLLEDIASITGGKAYYSGPGDFGMGKVYDDIASLQREEFASRRMTTLEDRFQIPLSLGAVLLIFGYFLPRRSAGKRQWKGRVA